MSNSGLLTNSNLLVLVIELAQINALNTKILIINTPVFETRLTAIGSSIRRSKKPKKVTKSKGYYILEEGKERDTSKIISYNIVPRNIIKEKHSIKQGTALLAY